MSYVIYWSGVHEAFSRPGDSSLEFGVFGIVYKGFITAFYQETSETHRSIMSGRIFDVRLNRGGEASYGGVNIYDEIVNALSRPVDQKYLPGLLLYDEEGLHLYDDITTQSDEYYLFPTEETLLKRHALDMAQVMQGRYEDSDQHPVGGAVLELGAG